eukprot:273244-Pelagomonas_calceolata.AAC.5
MKICCAGHELHPNVWVLIVLYACKGSNSNPHPSCLPACSYTCTLSGHEHAASHDLDSALVCYCKALHPSHLPACSYAYTLSGHEHAANDDLDSALTCYRNALRLDGRHYNAM